MDVLNGDGTRCTLFVSGCNHKCKGCYNKSTWSTDSGFLFTAELSDQIIKDLNCTRIKKQGLSLSGGDPLHSSNLLDILELVKRVKVECPDKDIWLWTGSKYDELTKKQKEVVQYVDVLIDGKYENKLSEHNLKWRGSSNQIIHYFNKKLS